MSRGEFLLYVALPYVCLAIFAVGHVWRYRREQLTWTARSTQLLERPLLRVGAILFHAGLLAVVGGHVLGILVPASWTEAVGIGEDAYHWLALVAGLTAGAAFTAGFLVLAYRRLRVARVRVTTTRSDLVLYPLLAFVIVTGMLTTIWGSAVDGHDYRETVSPWFRGLFTFDPDAASITHAPAVFQVHALSTFVLYAAWPFTRLVHAWSVPVGYLLRSPILYRSRNPRLALARERVSDGKVSP